MFPRLPCRLSVHWRNASLLRLARTNLGFAGIDAFDDFFDGFVFDDEVAHIYCRENLPDQVTRRYAGAVEAQPTGHFIEALEMQRGCAAGAIRGESGEILLEGG